MRLKNFKRKIILKIGNLVVIYKTYKGYWTSWVVLVLKNLPANAENVRDAGSIPGLGRSPGGGNGNPPQYSCRADPMDRGAWWAIVQGVPKN